MIDADPSIYTSFYGERFLHEPGALDGLAGERKRLIATGIMREAWQRGDDAHVITRAEVEAAR